MTLFTRALNLSLLSRMWDFYFLDGIFVLFQTAIGKYFYSQTSFHNLTNIRRYSYSKNTGKAIIVIRFRRNHENYLERTRFRSR